jgi:hypothetical protein
VSPPHHELDVNPVALQRRDLAPDLDPQVVLVRQGQKPAGAIFQ